MEESVGVETVTANTAVQTDVIQGQSHVQGTFPVRAEHPVQTAYIEVREQTDSL